MNISKLPWRLVEGNTSEVRDADNSLVCDDALRPPREDDMHFMVAACNAHAQLMTTLHNLNGYMMKCGYGADHPWRAEIKAALEAAKA